MKRFAWLLGLAMLGSVAAADLNKVLPPAEPAALEITYKPVPLNRENPKQTRVGELVYRGGLELRSHNKDFGGISGMRLWNNDTVLAVSDAGSWISFKLVEKKGRLVGVTGIAIAPILDKDGKPGVKAERDAEAVTRHGENGVCVAFEGQNAIWCYDDFNAQQPKATPAEIYVPEPMMAWPGNGGPEVLAESQTDDVPMELIMSEHPVAGDNEHAVILTQAHQSKAVYRSQSQFFPTDADFLDGTRVLILHRRFTPTTGVAAFIGLLDLDTDVQDGVLFSHEIARLAPPLTVDNMEGISYVERRGRKYIYIISDDNFSGLQRTLLMKFEWIRKK